MTSIPPTGPASAWPPPQPRAHETPAAGQPPSPPPGAQPNANGALIAIVVIVAILIVGVGLIALSDDDSESGRQPSAADAALEEQTSASGASPEAVVETFFDAVFASDCETLLGLLPAEYVAAAGATHDEQIAACQAQIVEPIPLEFMVEDVQLVSQDDTSAVVAVTASTIEDTVTHHITLISENSEWKVDMPDGAIVGPSNDLDSALWSSLPS